MAVHEHCQSDVMHNGHDPGAGLTDSHAAAGPVEPEVVRQQHADGLGGEMPDVFEVDHDSARQRLIKQGLEVRTKHLDRFDIVRHRG